MKIRILIEIQKWKKWKHVLMFCEQERVCQERWCVNSNLNMWETFWLFFCPHPGAEEQCTMGNCTTILLFGKTLFCQYLPQNTIILKSIKSAKCHDKPKLFQLSGVKVGHLNSHCAMSQQQSYRHTNKTDNQLGLKTWHAY